jgi:hypothetical protein
MPNTLLSHLSQLMPFALPTSPDDLPDPDMRDEYHFPGELSRGAQGRKVKLAQEWLSLSEISLNPDGDYGPATERAVERFQAVRGLPASGRIDVDTWMALIMPILRANSPILAGDKTLGELVIDYASQHLAEHPREIGHNKGPWVRMYLNGLEAPWCAGFVFYCVNQAARTMALTHPLRTTFSCDQLAARAKQLNLFVSEDQVAGMAPEEREAFLPPGTIFLRRHTPTDWTHTGLVVRATEDALETIEGNTNDEGSREGHEVCRRIRGYGNMDFVTITV